MTYLSSALQTVLALRSNAYATTDTAYFVVLGDIDSLPVIVYRLSQKTHVAETAVALVYACFADTFSTMHASEYGEPIT